MGHASLSETYDATLRGSAPDRRWDTREPTQLLEVGLAEAIQPPRRSKFQEGKATLQNVQPHLHPEPKQRKGASKACSGKLTGVAVVSREFQSTFQSLLIIGTSCQ
jgi:hypothetical protein